MQYVPANETQGSLQGKSDKQKLNFQEQRNFVNFRLK